MQHSAGAVVVIVSLLTLAKPGMTLDLGELQALPSSHPPYMFRLAISATPRGPSDLPAVRIRHPQDALSFVRNNVLELRLRSLSDVELEVSQNSQTLNRLLLKSELQAARARVEASPTAIHQQAAIVAGRQAPAGEAMALMPTITGVAARALLEGEVQGIRQEIQQLVGGVTPWGGVPMASKRRLAQVAIGLCLLLVWGVLVAALTSYFSGYVLQRRAAARARQRRQALLRTMRQLQGEVRLGATSLPGSAPSRRLGARFETPMPIDARLPARGGLSVSAPRLRRQPRQAPAALPSQIGRRSSQPRTPAPAEIVEALGNLRRELLRLQRVLPSSSLQDNPPADSRIV